jgi:periplasmic protein TonB
VSKNLQRFVPAVAGGSVVLLVVGLLIWFVMNMMHSKPSGPKRAVEQKITMIRPTPPPEAPPPPPPEEKIEEPIEQQEPEQAPEQADAAPAEQLGLDADGAAGSDGFGLAARKGGRDIVGSGKGAFVWYTSMLKDSILDALSSEDRVRKGAYKVNVRLWVAADGRVERVTLVSSSGNRELDAAIESALTRLRKVRDAPPLEMPQPVTLQIVSRG